MSKIEWTDTTWNPTTGCDKVSQGCKFCYAEVMSRRLKGMGQPKYQNGKNGFDLTIHPNTLDIPYKWRKPRMVFVNSMSDLFHEDVPLEFIKKVFGVMNALPQHTFQVLTKRAVRLYAYDHLLNWTPNIWMGVSVEDESVINRVIYLQGTNAHVKFLSCEPLIGPLPSLNLDWIDWVIVGGESGPKSRPIQEEWVQDILAKSSRNMVPFFFKQWGGKNKKASGRILNGRTYDQMPDLDRIIK